MNDTEKLILEKYLKKNPHCEKCEFFAIKGNSAGCFAFGVAHATCKHGKFYKLEDWEKHQLTTTP